MKEIATNVSEPASNREKRWAALSSVWAAVFLTLIKLIVGILTGSLGILADAAHSVLDLAAAIVTFFAVKISNQPADINHVYGHGKVENLSALFEALLLVLTCLWIFYEAIDRLFFKPVEVEATIWSFLVMTISLLVNISRSRLLSRVAKKYESQALEADALHFSTDAWSSAVVIGGLIMIVVARQFNLPWLVKGDAIAAIVVGCIVTYVSIQLGRQAVGELMDETPQIIRDEITQAANLIGVDEVRQVRVRRSGAQYFADLTLAVSRSASSEQAHQIAEEVEKAVRNLLPGANVVVHVDPVRVEGEPLTETLRTLASRMGFGVHHIKVSKMLGKQILSLHLDVEEELPLEEAHTRASAIEKAILEECPGFDQVWTHLEPVQRQRDDFDEVTSYHSVEMEHLILELPQIVGVHCEIHDVVISKEEDHLNVSFRCLLDGQALVKNAHKLAEQMEVTLRSRIVNLDQVMIHMEPLIVTRMPKL